MIIFREIEIITTARFDKDSHIAICNNNNASSTLFNYIFWSQYRNTHTTWQVFFHTLYRFHAFLIALSQQEDNLTLTLLQTTNEYGVCTVQNFEVVRDALTLPLCVKLYAEWCVIISSHITYLPIPILSLVQRSTWPFQRQIVPGKKRQCENKVATLVGG